MRVKPTHKQWFLIALITAAAGLLARYLWQRRSGRKT